MPKRREVREAGGRVAAPTKLANGQQKMRARLIAGEVQGSSGFYPRAVVERDGPRAFPKGTHMHLDHQSFMEMWSRPEGSVKDIAGVIAGDPVYERYNPLGEGLYADILLFSEHANMLVELAPYIGLSIVAIANSEEGESPATGEMTDIVTEILYGFRVDFVTFPGADGRITEIIESHIPPELEPGQKEIRETTPLTGESAGSNKEGEVNEVDKETADKILAGIESMNTNFTALTTALTAEAAARQAKESGPGDDEETPKVPLDELVANAVEALIDSGLPKAARSRVIEAVKNHKPLQEAIDAEKAYIAALSEGKSGNGSPNGGGGAFVADRSGKGGDDSLTSAWWMSEAGLGTRDPNAIVVESSDLMAWGR